MSDQKPKLTLYCISCDDAINISEDDLDNEVRKFKKIHPTCSKLEAFLGGRSLGLFYNDNIKTFDRLLN